MPQLPRLLLIAAVCAALTPACAGNTLRRQHEQQMAEADALFMRGSYVALRKAFDLYDRLRQAAYLPAISRAKAFDTAILLAAREKDLGMAASPWIERAEWLRPAGVAMPGTPAQRAALYLELARAIPWSDGRLDPPDATKIRSAVGPVADALKKWDTALGPASARDLVGTHLMAMLRCAHSPSKDLLALKAADLAPVHAATPLMKYTVGGCKLAFIKELDGLANDPEFHEAAYQIGKLRIFDGGPTMYVDAKALHEAAYAGLPDALANTWKLAVALGALMDYDGCAAKYDEIVRKGGARRQAMLERTVCLSRGLKRTEAVASATDLVDTPGIFTGEGYFWRAWNRYYLKELAAARADVDSAKSMYRAAAVYALSGFIAYDQDQKDYSYTEFGAAVAMESDYCIAHFYRGLIDTQKLRWKQASDIYAVATSCYERSVAGLQKELEDAKALPPEDPTRERRIQNLTEGLEVERLMAARSTYNTGYSFAQVGDVKLASYYVERAGKMHKDMEKLAADMLEALRKQGK